MIRTMWMTLMIALALTTGCTRGDDPKMEGAGPTVVAAPGARDEKNPEAGPAIDPAKKAEADAKAEEWIPQEERERLVLDFTLEDQDANLFDLKTIKGKPTVATFIFTRCPNPNMCPLQAANMTALQKQLKTEGLADKVNLLIISFDPEYDTPERLKKFAENAGFNFELGKALRPNPREFAEFRYVFQFRIGYLPDGSLTHKTDLMMIDAQGRLARQYAGMWKEAQALEDVKKLIEETASTSQ